MSVQDGRRSELDTEAESLDGETTSAPSTPEPPEPPPVATSAPRGYSWRATMDLEPGMVIARPVVGHAGSRATMHLAIGSVITADTLAQLVNKGVECVAILDDHPPNPEDYAGIVLRYEARLREIFEPEPDETCRPLFDALIKNGPLEC
ncbi:MAG: hypothetical protein NT159_11545 [Proteobacteria bacterium]|nr:hypothetical protein [Pseudomonadota bacterium]